MKMTSVQKLLRTYQRKTNRQYRRRLFYYLLNNGKIKAGATRFVIIRKNSVVKIPTIFFSLDSFLQGWIANRNEKRKWYAAVHLYKQKETRIEPEPKKFLCPVKHTYLFGLILVMQKALPIEQDDFEDNYRMKLTYEQDLDYWCGGSGEIRYTNFGYLNEQVVCVDYGAD